MTQSNFIPFLVARNLIEPERSDACPWNFRPDPETLKLWRGLPKETRKERTTTMDCDWNVYSAFEGVNPHLRVSKENPAACVRGIVADFDTSLPVEVVEGILKQMPPEFAPNFIERSLSMKFRLVWVFERPLLVTGSEHAAAVYRVFALKFKLATLLAGYDKNSEKPAEVWTNGGEWIEYRKDPLPWSLIFGMAVDAGRTLKAARADMPIEAVAEEVAKKWPGRWQGAFEVDALGVRFWDDSADAATGCQVKPDGMLCFTGTVPFMKWERIFGTAWVNERRALNLADIAQDTYFDGRSYHRPIGGAWFDACREDVLLDLTVKGLDTRKQKGQTVSEAARVLHHIQTVNRIHGAAPLIYSPNGVVDIGGLRILNTNNLEPVKLANGRPTPPDFPLMAQFMAGFLALAEGKNPLAHLEAYWRRVWDAALEHDPIFAQALFLCGPISNGKTLFVKHMLAASLGGRVANPYRFFVGLTDFTDELFGSPVWAINDEEAPDAARKRTMEAKLKSCVVNPENTYHPKFAKKLSLPCFSRIAVTMNIGPSSVGMLPEANDDTRDKMMFFATQPFAGTWPEKKVLEAQIKHELPKYGRWLFMQKAPAYVTDGALRRMGVVSYFDPRLLALSQQQTYFFTFCELLPVWAQNAPTFQGETWDGNPTKLAAEMHSTIAIQEMMREWTVDKIARALNSIARLGGLGVEFVEGAQSRVFRLTKSQLVKSSGPVKPSIQ